MIEYMVTGGQIRMARAALRLGVREVAELVGVAPMTISRIETGQSSGQGDTLAKIRRALEKAGIEFIDEDGGGPGVRLRKAGRKGK
jgi:transcriptional regulator with XRE-family HTH domain